MTDKKGKSKGKAYQALIVPADTPVAKPKPKGKNAPQTERKENENG